MTSPFVFVLICLASYRAWRLIGRDEITAGPRDWIDEKSARVGDFLSCPWCLGAWLSFAAVAAVDRWFVPLPLPVLWGLAVSCVVGLIGAVDD